MTTTFDTLAVVAIGAVLFSCLSTGHALAQDDEAKDGEPRHELAHFAGASSEQRQAYELASKSGEVLAQSGAGAAIELLQRAIEIDPDDTIGSNQAHSDETYFPTYRRLASLLRREERYEESLQVYGMLLARFPNAGPSISFEIAQVWEKMGDKRRALEFYWRAAEEGYHPGPIPRSFLTEAIVRLVPESEVEEQLFRQVYVFDDWVAHYHLAQFYKFQDYDRPAAETVPALEKTVLEYRHALIALKRSPCRGEMRLPPWGMTLEEQYNEAVAFLEDERERLDAEVEEQE